MLDRAVNWGTPKWAHSALTTSLAAAAHEDYLVKPAVGNRARIQTFQFQVTGPAGAGAGTHELDIFLTDGTNEIQLMQSSEAFGAGLEYKNDTSSDASARPDVLDRPMLPMLQNLVLSSDIYLIIRYTNNTDVATTRARNYDVSYIEN